MPFEMVFANFSAISSISIGITSFLFSFILMFATNGTPIAKIGTPRLFEVKIFR